MINSEKIGRKIASLRKERGLTGEQLAGILCVTAQAISKWENGKCLPETATLPVLARVLGCSIDEILVPGKDVFLVNSKIELEVRKLLDKETEGLSQEDILSVTELKLNKMELSDAYDLSQFKNLITLELQDNWLTDLSPLTGLTKLETLIVSNDPFLPAEQKPVRKNTFSNIDFIQNLTNLKKIGFVDCGLSDITPLKYLKKLEHASLYCSKISDIGPLRCLKNLKWVTFYDSMLSDISVFQELPQIEVLAINCNRVYDLSPLKECLNLMSLDAHTNSIYDITPLAKLTKMVYLTLEGNCISDISCLENMHQLQYLTLSLNPFLKDISAVKKMKTLRHLALANMDISDTMKEKLRNALPDCQIVYSIKQ